MSSDQESRLRLKNSSDENSPRFKTAQKRRHRKYNELGQRPRAGERTFIEIKTLEEIISDELLDWSNIGMILSVLNQPRPQP